jgi:hypothetical protein
MELLKTESLKPHQSEFEGWMGNSGNTMDRWYHRAALILWRKSDARFFQLSMDLKVALHGLVADFPARPKQIQNEVQRLMPWLNERAAGSEHVMEFVELAMVLDEPALARDLLVPMLATMISSQKFSLLEGLVGKYGDDWLKQFFDTSNNSGKDSWAARQALHESAASLDHWYRKFPGLGPVLLGSLLETSYRRWKSADESSRRTVLENRKTAFPMIRILLKSLLAEPDIERRFASKLVDEILKRKNLFAAAETAQILLDSLQGQSISLSSAPESFKCLVKVMKERLLMDTSIARDEGDWSIHEQPHCDCDDCQLLRDFLQNSKARSTFLPINAERRQHIHQMIDALAIPVTHQTRREGSPYKLVLNKKEELFAQFSKGKAMARQALDSLEGLQ